VRGKTYETFLENDLVRSAVERQLEIIGEALSQLAKIDPQIAGNVAELRRIIAFRNAPTLPSPASGGGLRRGPATIDYDTVWRLIEDKLPVLEANLRLLLGTSNPAPDAPAG
jgi:uncharacterized protein with HEPN domain